jgi:cytosine/adenosine deaminase-related metal-dependent hydrolase
MANWVMPISSAPIPDGAVAISRDRITAVGLREDVVTLYPDARVSGFGAAAIIPGLINCHTHLELTVMRGFLEDVEHDFFSWLRKLTVARMTQLTTEDLYVSAAWGAMEAAAAGITCLGDASSSAASSLAALRDVGLRGIVYQEVFGPDAAIAKEALEGLREKVEPLRELDTRLVKVGVSPHAPYTVSGPLLSLVADYSGSEDLRLMIHASESRAEELFLTKGEGQFAEGLFQRSIDWTPPGISTIGYLDSVGILHTKPLLAHCIRVDHQDISLIKERGAGIAHCPKSNAKLGHGRAPFSSFVTNGLKVGIGSDSVASNNGCDMLEEARTAVLLSRSSETDISFGMISAKDALAAATLGGARAMGLENELGTLEAGKQADLAIVSLEGIHQRPVYDAVSALIFSSTGRDVVLTVVAGREVYRAGQVVTVDRDRLSARLNEIEETLKG